MLIYAIIKNMLININKSGLNVYNLLRRAGYHPDRFQPNDDLSFSRPLRGARYPRFHIYYKKSKNVLNLHLDQKSPKYQSAPDHGAEYDGELVEKEAKRIESILETQI